MMTIVRLLLLSFFGSSYGAGADTCQSVKGLVLGMGAAMLGGRNAGDQAVCFSTCQAHVRDCTLRDIIHSRPTKRRTGMVQRQVETQRESPERTDSARTCLEGLMHPLLLEGATLILAALALR